MRKVTFPFLKTLVIVFGVLLLATNVALAQVPVSLPNIASRVGITRPIDVTVGTISRAMAVISYQFDLLYDSTTILVTNYTLEGTISAGVKAPVVVISTPGIVRVAVASDSAIFGSGTLIRFYALMKTLNDTSYLNLSGFKFNEGSPASTVTNGRVIIPLFSVSLPAVDSVKVKQDSIFNIPITTDFITGRGILSYQFAVSYDTNFIVITGVDKAGTISANMSILVNATVAGRISVAAASDSILSGGDGATLIYLQARIKPNAHGTSALTFVDGFFQYNEGTPPVGAVDGSIYVKDITAIRQTDPVPTKYVLDQNYPNPFNPTTMITFGLPKESNVTLEVYNILGMKVRTLIAGERMNAAKYSIDWDGKDNSGMSVPSGVYLYRLHTDKFDAARKMVLVK